MTVIVNFVADGQPQFNPLNFTFQFSFGRSCRPLMEAVSEESFSIHLFRRIHQNFDFPTINEDPNEKLNGQLANLRN